MPHLVPSLLLISSFYYCQCVNSCCWYCCGYSHCYYCWLTSNCSFYYCYCCWQLLLILDKWRWWHGFANVLFLFICYSFFVGKPVYLASFVYYFDCCLFLSVFLILLVFSAGLAQYSGDPKTEWHLKDHPTKESLLDAIANLPYKGGNTMTGDSTALPHNN